MSTPADEFAAFERQDESIQVGPRARETVPEPAPARPAPMMTLARAIPPTDTIVWGGEVYELRPLMILSVGTQTRTINDRNAQLRLREREEQGEELTIDEQALQEFYLRRVIKTAVPTLPESAFMDPREGGMLPEQQEALANLFFTRSADRREAAGATVSRPISPNLSPVSSDSTAAARSAGSGSPRNGSTPSRRKSAR